MRYIRYIVRATRQGEHGRPPGEIDQDPAHYPQPRRRQQSEGGRPGATMLDLSTYRKSALPVDQQHSPSSRPDNTNTTTPRPSGENNAEPRSPPALSSPFLRALKKPFVKSRSSSGQKPAAAPAVTTPLGPPPRLEHQRNGVFQTYIGAMLGHEVVLEMLLQHTTPGQLESLVVPHKTSTAAAGGAAARAAEANVTEICTPVTPPRTAAERFDFTPPFSKSLMVEMNLAECAGVDDQGAVYDASTSSKPRPAPILTTRPIFDRQRNASGSQVDTTSSSWSPPSPPPSPPPPSAAPQSVTHDTWPAYNAALDKTVLDEYLAWSEEQESDDGRSGRRRRVSSDDEDDDSDTGTVTGASSSSTRRGRRGGDCASVAYTDSDIEGIDSLCSSRITHLSLPSAVQSTHVLFDPAAARVSAPASASASASQWSPDNTPSFVPSTPSWSSRSSSSDGSRSRVSTDSHARRGDDEGDDGDDNDIPGDRAAPSTPIDRHRPAFPIWDSPVHRLAMHRHPRRRGSVESSATAASSMVSLDAVQQQQQEHHTHPLAHRRLDTNARHGHHHHKHWPGETRLASEPSLCA